ncbi:MAG: FkbM family methyltransferase [Alteromonadaceae bacterium]|nr:FkbM family methyltransferase [Alteromonadaceae bacterium]
MIDSEQFKILMREYVDVPRKQPVAGINFADLTIDIPDAASFLSQVRDIFLERQYLFKANSEEPVILDVGANIGLASLFFAKQYPTAHIVAYEADPVIFDYMQRNLRQNEISNVVSKNEAAWNEESKLGFLSTGTDAGHMDSAAKTLVKAVDFSRELQQFEQIDLLKMDIEGSENVVFPTIEEHLPKIHNLIFEYHSEPTSEQQLARMLSLMEKHGFRYHLHQVNKRRSPLVNRVPAGYFDCQVNIFAYRIPR